VGQPSMRNLEGDDASDDEGHAEVAKERRRVAVVQDSNGECSRRPDSGPDRIRGADRDRSLSKPKQKAG